MRKEELKGDVDIIEVDRLRNREAFLEAENRKLNNKLTLANQRIATLEKAECFPSAKVNEVEMSIGNWTFLFDRDTCTIRASK